MRKYIIAVCTLALCALAPLGAVAHAADSTTSTDQPGVVDIAMVTVGDPGNPSVGVTSAFGTKGDFVQLPPNGGIHKNCSDAPAGPPNCITTGGVKYTYQIGELEATVAQYVTFLNVADPNGKNRKGLYLDNMSPTVWPEYGSVTFSSSAALGQHYSVAYPEWADKPFAFANFLRAARFVNSLDNGKVLSKSTSAADGFTITTYKVRLSPKIDQGMYDLKNPSATRAKSSGFVVPSDNEWVKAAYFDPKGGGIDSYWQYPTGPTDPPSASSLDPATGDVVNASTQPLATYNPQFPGSPEGTFPTWCPSQAGADACANTNPINLPAGLDYSRYQGNVSTVGQTLTRSPWGTLDQGGNVVEWEDTIVPAPPGYTSHRTWRRMHGGVANAAAYQMAISAFGFQPEDQYVLDQAYPWFGFRVGIVGTVG